MKIVKPAVYRKWFGDVFNCEEPTLHATRILIIMTYFPDELNLLKPSGYVMTPAV
jgi:hypothetical protein